MATVCLCAPLLFTMPTPTYLQHHRIAIEQNYGQSPSGTGASSWWTGGAWHDVYADFSELQGRQAIVFPESNPAERFLNAASPLVARRWSDGQLAAPFAGGIGGVLLAAALGNNVTTVATVSTPNTSLLVAEPINSDPKSLVLAAQPANGAVLRFEMLGPSGGGSISVSGLDVGLKGTSEILSFASAGYYYTRNSYRGVGASGIAVSGLTNGSLTVIGIGTWAHTVSATSTVATLAIEQYGPPQAGATSRSMVFNGVTVKRLTLETDAEAVDGILRVTADLEGSFPAACAATDLNSMGSLIRVWPGWTLSVKKNGATYTPVARNTLVIDTGNKLQESADSANPQGVAGGPIEVTGTAEIVVGNEAEYNEWLGTSGAKLEFTWDTPYALTINRNLLMGITMENAFIESHRVGEQDGAYRLSLNYRNVMDGNSKLTTTFRTQYPGTGLGGTVK